MPKESAARPPAGGAAMPDSGPAADFFHVGEVRVDLERRLATVQGRPLRLTPMEWRLLELLWRHKPRTISQEAIAEELSTGGHTVEASSVVVHVYNLRRKLGRDQIETIRGHGVRLRD